MNVDEDVSRKGKFSRCIVCSDYSLRTTCYNIFNTTLENGKILLSEFLKNVLDCSVLIVVSPDFFVCKRCFILCHNLDYSINRCNDIQGKIKTLFKNSEQRLKMIREGLIPDEGNAVDIGADIKEEIEDGSAYLDEASHEYYVEEEDQETFEDQLVKADEVGEVDADNFVLSDLVESEVTVGNTEDYVAEEYGDDQPVTQIEVEPPVAQLEVELQRSQKNLKENILSQKETLPQDGVLVWEDDMLISESDGMLLCKVCGLGFENQELLKNHRQFDNCKKKYKSKVKSIYEFQNFSVKLKKKKKVFFCNRCTYETNSSSDITKHLKSHKTEPEYMCDICGRRFKFLKTFNRHQQVHDESRPFACKLCPFRAMTEVLLKIHERQHDDQKKFTCSQCGYKTLKKMSYLIHCRTHTGERPYCCPTCPYKAKDPSTLQRHRRIHGGIKAYQCTVCNFKSVQKAGLTIHMMMHTGEKPYACELCDYRSYARHNLKAHITAIHNDEKPFACNQCSYRTKMKRLLTYHMRKHTGEKPFACHFCDERFRYRSALSYHMSKKHPVDQDGNVQTYLVLNYCESKKLKFDQELVFSDEADSGSENELVIT